MRKMICLVMVFLFSLTFISACGPSEEAIATMTASAWTPTPKPTLTPTPIPYDMVLSLADNEGNPINMAYVMVHELDMTDTPVDSEGKIEFLNIPGEMVTVSVLAQGYFPVEEKITLERGMNQVELTFEPDPSQILPSTACQPGQTVLSVEDFEDQILQDWEGYTRPMWEVVKDESGTIISSIGGARLRHVGQEFGNMVWHMDILRPTEVDVISFRFHQFNEGSGEYSYIAVFFQDGVMIQREEPDGPPSLAMREQRAPDGETWEKFSLVYFEGEIEIWKNDELLLAVHEENPFEKGTISMELTPTEDRLLLDNIIICELTEPYAPPVAEENVD